MSVTGPDVVIWLEAESCLQVRSQELTDVGVIGTDRAPKPRAVATPEKVNARSRLLNLTQESDGQPQIWVAWIQQRPKRGPDYP